MGLRICLVLHSADHVSDHGTHRGLEDFKREIDNIFRNPSPQQKSCTFVSEMVAIVFEEVVGLHAEFGVDVHQKFSKDIFWNLGSSQRDFVDWSSVRSHARRPVADPSSEVKFLIDYSG